MPQFELARPKPDFDHLVQVLNGEKEPQRVLFAELLIDEEVKKHLYEQVFGEKNVPPPTAQRFGSSDQDRAFRETREYRLAYDAYHRQLINLYHRLGYSFIPDLEYYLNFSALNLVSRVGKDTALLSREERYWAEESYGMIRNWQDFERFPWAQARQMLSTYGEHLERMSRALPDGMKIASQAAMFEPVLEWLLGYQGLFYLTYDHPDLVEAVFNEVGKLVLESYRIAAPAEKVGVIWHGDDLGYKAATLLSPELLRRWVFPWFRRFAEVAREHRKPFWYHCCGNKEAIMEDLIEGVGIDALHAFEDSCCPVVEYKKRYGRRIGLIGGIDMDKLARLDEEALRRHVRQVLQACMEGGRYVLGSGNSICNFIPVGNYLAMLEEGNRWR